MIHSEATKLQQSKTNKFQFKLGIRVPWNKGRKVPSFKITKAQKKAKRKEKQSLSFKSVNWSILKKLNYHTKRGPVSHFNG